MIHPRLVFLYCVLDDTYLLLGEDAHELDKSQEEDRQDQEDVDKAPVEENRQPPLPKSVNFLGEDVDSLMISLFDRKRSKYICQECKIICNLPMVGFFM